MTLELNPLLFHLVLVIYCWRLMSIWTFDITLVPCALLALEWLFIAMLSCRKLIYSWLTHNRVLFQCIFYSSSIRIYWLFVVYAGCKTGLEKEKMFCKCWTCYWLILNTTSICFLVLYIQKYINEIDMVMKLFILSMLREFTCNKHQGRWKHCFCLFLMNAVYFSILKFYTKNKCCSKRVIQMSLNVVFIVLQVSITKLNMGIVWIITFWWLHSSRVGLKYTM